MEDDRKKPAYVDKQEKAEAKRQKAEQHSDRQEIVSALQRVAEQDKAAHYHTKRGERFHRIVEKLTFRLERRKYWLEVAGTAGLWSAAAVGLAAIIVASHDASEQNRAMRDQQDIMKRQMVLMEADQRPWLKPLFKILAPLIFDSQGLQLRLSGETTNIGKSPAFDAQLFPLIVTTGVDFAKAQKDICDRVRQRPKGGDGLVVFPGASITNSPISSGLSWEDINKGKTMLRFDTMKPELLGIVITGCVTYLFPNQVDDRHHQTGFGYFLRQTKMEIRGIDTNQVGIPISDITYETWPELNWAD
jgi:hypothetical protein